MTAPLRMRSVQVFLLAMSVLMLEVALTRVFSFIMFYHFTYLVISVALLGFGAAGTYLTARPPADRPATADDFVARNAGWFGLAAIGAVLFIPRIHFYPTDMAFYGDYSQLLSLLFIVVAAGLPFFFAGSCIGHIISRAGDAINRVYFADLVGAALGCLMAIVAINRLGGIAACFAVGALGLLVAAISSIYRRLLYTGGFLATVLLTAVIAYTECLPLYVPPDKVMFRQEHLVELIQWHPITRIDVTRPRKEYRSFGGALSTLCQDPPTETRFIYQDGDALTGIIRPAATLGETAVLGQYLQGAPYLIKNDAEALVIGCGGGVDIMIALYHGAKHVVGVDINPHTIALIRGRYADFARGVFQRDDVELVVSEGRHFLTRDARRFDVIQLSGVDTFTALAAGAYALTENFIYTREALDQYLAHLKPDGIVNFSRPLLTPPRETLKLAITAVEALAAQGAERPAAHLMVLSGKGLGTAHPIPWGQTLIKRSPFTRTEAATLARWAESLGFQVVYDPFRKLSGNLTTYIQATPQQRAKLIAEHPLDVAPATDDRPFFFQFYRWGELWPFGEVRRGPNPMPVAVTIILASLAQVVLLSGVFILYPLYRRRQPAARSGGRGGIFSYFAALGLGFITIEIALLQKFTVFLGGPAYSMAVMLFAILLFSGLGSLVSERLTANPFRLICCVIPVLVVLVLVGSFEFSALLDRMLGLSHLHRCLAAVGLVAPLGFLMGMPFPSGLRLVDRRRPELAPWAWGINACATVVGTVVCIILSSAAGFSHAMQFGAAVYLVGCLIFAWSQREFADAASVTVE
ncbi:MAG: class I SAM-dependent methyltransferase [Planctomycetota bacterium]